MEFVMKQNDTYPFFRAQLRDVRGIVSLEGYEEALLHITRVSGEEKLKEPVEVIDEENGYIQYKWKPEDTEEVGVFLGEVQVTFIGGKILTFPNDNYFKLKIVKELL